MMQLVSAKRHKTGQRTYLDISFGLGWDLHDELGARVDHVLENLVVNTIKLNYYGTTLERIKSTYTAPKLSELEAKRYSLPSAKSWSRTPDWYKALYKSP